MKRERLDADVDEEGGKTKNRNEHKKIVCVCLYEKSICKFKSYEFLAILQLKLSKPFRHSTDDDAWCASLFLFLLISNDLRS